MRILYLDIDTLRADHLGCYGYHRKTSPNIDKVAESGVRFEKCFASDAPCLPSRSSFFGGRFGIHSGVVNHGGLNADPYPEGKNRGFSDSPEFQSFVTTLKKSGLHTVSVSPFAERHASWWFYSGFKEMFNTGKHGSERADEIYPYAEEWLNKNAETDNWFLHVNMWDPHTVYKTPKEFGNPFKNEPPPAWINEKIIKEHYEGYGPYSARDRNGFSGGVPKGPELLEMPNEIKSLEDYKQWIDGYDLGINYADHYAGKIIDLLKKHGVFEDTVIMISSDHGENQGEFNIYGDHQTADTITSRVPFILKWPGLLKPGVDKGLHYQVDIGATILELLKLKVPAKWDGESFAGELKKGKEYSRDFIVVSQCAWSCQRAVIFGDFLFMKTYHTGLKNFPEHMLFDFKKDPHLLKEISKQNPQKSSEGLVKLTKWREEMMRTSTSGVDPLDTVMEEGGPYHARGEIEAYCKRLSETGRKNHALTLKKFGGRPVDRQVT